MAQIVVDGSGRKIGSYEGNSDSGDVFDENGNFAGRYFEHEIFDKNGNSRGYHNGDPVKAVEILLLR